MATLPFKRLDHVSLTARDLDATVEFYSRVFGAEVEYRMGPFDAADIPKMEDGRDWTAAHINVPDARVRIAVLGFPFGLRMELHEYARPEGAATEPPRNCDAGSRHVCLEVDDLDASIEYLRAHGCTPMAGSIDMFDGPCPPSRSWYVLDPFGNQLELVEYR